jgi:membrane protein implicated in regulation of membrane protease activity
MGWLRDTQWLLWIAAALVAGLLEITSLDFVFAMLVAGALAAAGAAFLGYSFTVQTLVFAGTSAVGLAVVRPAIKKWATRNSPFIPTNVDALQGKRAEALTEITDRTGSVKLDGETWSARCDPGAALIPAGELVQVVQIDGATAVVRSIPPGPATSPPPATPDGQD